MKPGQRYDTRRRISISKLGCLVALTICFAISTSVVLMGSMSPDEHMYVSAGQLLMEHALYSDFSYLQAPYMAYIYDGVFQTANSE